LTLKDMVSLFDLDNGELNVWSCIY
jgi:hypothetical protein